MEDADKSCGRGLSPPSHVLKLSSPVNWSIQAATAYQTVELAELHKVSFKTLLQDGGFQGPPNSSTFC